MDFKFPEQYEFFNVKTGETRILKARGSYAKHMINGFILSSNLSRNSNRGQDFGWRLARDTLVTVKKAQQNPMIMREIATAKGVSPRGVRLPDLIEFLVDSYNNTVVAQEIAEDESPRFQAEYEASLRGTDIDPSAGESSDIITDDKVEESDVSVPTGEVTTTQTPQNRTKAPAKKA